MTLDDALATAENAPPGSVSAILRAEILRLRGERRPPDGWVEVWAIASVGADGAWETFFATHDMMATAQDRQKEADEYAEDGRRITLIRAYVPPPEPILEAAGEAETINMEGKTNG